MSGPLDFDDHEPERAERPAAQAPPPAGPQGAGRWTVAIGLVALIVVILVTINAVGGGSVPQGGPEPGSEVFPFAVPLADAPPRADGQEDANLLEDRACRVRGPGILNICQELERGPVVFALFPSDAERCSAVLDQLDRVAPRVPGVRFVAVGSRGRRADLRGEHPYPVGWDRDGGLAAAYGLVGCPQITFAEQGSGEVVATTRQPLSDGELLRRARELAP